MSLVPKLDEVQKLLLRLNVQVGCIVESWLKQYINDSVVNTDGYNIVRKIDPLTNMAAYITFKIISSSKSPKIYNAATITI